MPTEIPLNPQDRKLEAGDIFDARWSREMNLAQRMHLLMTRLDYVQKDRPQPVDGGKALKYSIVTHDKVTALVREHAVACGVIITPVDVSLQIAGNMAIVTMQVEFRNIDDPSDVITVATCGNGIDPGDKGPGKAMSYAFKYALLKGLMLETGDDPDTDQDVERLTDDEMQVYDMIRQLQRSVDQEPEVVVSALEKNGQLHTLINKISKEATARAPEIRAQASALARAVEVNLRETWA